MAETAIFDRRVRCAAAWREELARRAARQGATPRILGRLRRLRQFEAGLWPAAAEPVAARDDSDELLSAAVLLGLARGRYLPVRLTGDGRYLLDLRRYRQLLLALFRAGLLAGGRRLSLRFCARDIMLCGAGFWPDAAVRRLAGLLGGTVLRRHGAEPATLIVLPAPPAEAGPSAPVPTAGSYLRDSFSDVYLYLAP